MSTSSPSHQPQPLIDPKFGLMLIAAEHLIPLFKVGNIDSKLARRMAISAIDAYQPESRADYVNVARTIAFSMTALALLGKTASPDMTTAEYMRATGRANALNRSADQSERTMMQRQRRQKAAPLPEQIAATPASAAPNSETGNPETGNPETDNAEIQAALGHIMQEYQTISPTAAAPSPAATPSPAPAPTAVAIEPATPKTSSRPIPPSEIAGGTLRYTATEPKPQPTPYMASLLRSTAMPHGAGSLTPNR